MRRMANGKRTITTSDLKNKIADGWLECITDLKVGYVHVRWVNGNRETLDVVPNNSPVDQYLKNVTMPRRGR